jgi:uncharacterized damage-inducible protein DinB
VTTLDHLNRLWSHATWADNALLNVFEGAKTVPAEVLVELAHVVGAEETWLSRLEGRKTALPIWPELSREELLEAARRVQSGYAKYFASLRDDDLSRPVPYTNSVGKSFLTPIEDILLHVVLHGQYHRGKVNLMLRQSGAQPAPVDFIAYVRGVPAAVAAHK